MGEAQQGGAGVAVAARAVAGGGGAGRIRVLPEAVTSRIAAGEVVERPASVVKELAENALDAGARRVDVEISGGGRELVRVCDDGLGMLPEDLAACVLPHATSKLVSADDLPGLATLGFRGEALPSIAAVSRFAVTSRPRAPRAGGGDSGCAWRIEIVGGVPSRPQPRPASGAPGTTVEVRDLFFNLPPRLKFLKGQAAEAAACAETLMRLALSRPDAGFTLRQDQQEIFSVPPCAAPLAAPAPGCAAPPLPLSAFARRARDLLGPAASRGLLELDTASEAPPGTAAAQPYRLYGLISPPAVTRANRSSIYLTVNGRPVKDRTLTSALLESCRHLLPPKRYPCAVLYLDLPGEDVDINVHPTKAEVRFRVPGLVYALFHHAVRQACGVKSAAAPNPPPPPLPPRTPLGAPRPLNGQAALDFSLPLAPVAPVHVGPSSPSATPEAPAASPAPSSAAPQDFSSPPTLSPRVAEDEAPFGIARTSPDSLPRLPLAPDVAALRPVPAAAPAPAPRGPAPFRVLGQAGGSYIVLEDDHGVQLVDQHALHERVLFEMLLARAENFARGDAQGLLIAETLALTPAQAAVFGQNSAAREVLADLGFDVEPFGPRALAVRAVPAILKGACAHLVCEVLDALGRTDEHDRAGRSPADRAHYREKAAYVLSCKGALKAGERLTLEQMTALVAEYRSRVGAGSFTCPHGRPLAKEISWAELERAVGRA
jgi:DNA mismatch repair protein MutL